MINVILILGTLIIPAINLQAEIITSPIVNNMHDIDVIGYNQVGHLEGTGWPSTNTYKTVLAAHNYLEFDKLKNIAVGATVYVVIEHDKIYTYKVISIATTPQSNVELLYPSSTSHNTLVLLTCTDQPDMRFVVIAERVF